MVVAYRPTRRQLERIGRLADVEAELRVVAVANVPHLDVDGYEPPIGFTLVASSENLGFAGGVNVGVARAFADGAEVAVIANDDVRLDPSAVARLVEATTPTRVVAPTMSADEPQDAFAGGVIDWRHGFAYHRAGGSDFLTGAAFALRRETWQRVGPFDATLFLYYEDVDWCLRARAAGIELAVLPDVTVHHVGGASSGGTAGATWAYYHTRNRIRIVRRYRGRVAALRAWCWTLAWTVGYLRDGRRRLIPAQLRGLRDAAFHRAGRGPYPRDP